MNLYQSLLIFDLYLYMNRGAVFRAGGARWHGSLATMTLFLLGLWASMDFPLYYSYWASTVHIVIKSVM
jgi:hypothetical protein